MPKDIGWYPTGPKAPVKPRRQMSPAKRAMRDRSTKGSPPAGMSEFKQGYRRCAQ